ncbi:hypothetical protein BKA59DRAFT_504339 [Fusarium tricinctum]|uniref:ATP-dependent RNA helicase n=1 Tax=Fusarium tricinctum TaxID=61284 RepID=A0A8K0RLD9_9HYPO|nr:hypothetical protein BKA59DRAFT_504339 [Fusarium tricinctum]
MQRLRLINIFHQSRIQFSPLTTLFPTTQLTPFTSIMDGKRRPGRGGRGGGSSRRGLHSQSAQRGGRPTQAPRAQETPSAPVVQQEPSKPPPETLDSRRFDSLSQNNQVHPVIFMTPVQAATMDELLPPNRNDCLVQARTGTGKTMAFLNRAAGDGISLLISAEATKVLQRLPKYRVQVAIGGTNKDREERQILGGCEILIATPGRLLDHMSNSDIVYSMRNLNTLVLDEADRLLDMGFMKDLREIVNRLPDKTKSDRQGMLFSATIAPHVQQVAGLVLAPGYKFISTIPAGEANTHERVPQFLVQVPTFGDVAPAMVGCVREEATRGQAFKAILFAPTAAIADFYGELLEALPGLPPVSILHSRMSQNKRTKITNDYRTARSAILVATDVVARGMDFPGVTTVIQVGMPADKQSYIHRLGRTARADAEGRGILIYSLKEISFKPLAEKMEDDSKTRIYQAWLGYYNSHMKSLKWDKEELVRQANVYAREGLGSPDIPAIQKSTASKMGLKGVRGLNTVADRPRQKHGAPGGHGDSGRGKRGHIYFLQSSNRILKKSKRNMQQSHLSFENGFLRILTPCQQAPDTTSREWTDSNLDDICLDLFGSPRDTNSASKTGNRSSGKFSRKYKVQSRLGSRNGTVVVREPLAHIHTSSTSNSVNTKTTAEYSLFSLPTEIRLVIYHHLLVSTTLPVLCPAPNGFRIINETPFHPHFGFYPQILQTCKAINKEATPILYSENVFRRKFYWPTTWSRRSRRIHWPLSDSSPISRDNFELISRIRLFEDSDKWLRDGRLRILNDVPGLKELQIHVDMSDSSRLLTIKETLRSVHQHHPNLLYLKVKIRQPFDQAYKDWCNECQGKSMSFSLHLKRKAELEEWMEAEGIFVGKRLLWSFLTELSEFCGPSCIIGFMVDQSCLRAGRIECCIVHEGEPTFSWLPTSLKSAFLFCVAFLLSIAAAMSLSDMPKCALPCALQAFKSASSAGQSTQDMCKSADSAQSVQECVSTVCTLREGLQFQSFVTSICNIPSGDHRQEYRVVIITFTALSFLCVVLRVAARFFVKTSWGADDTWAVITFLIIVPATAFVLFAIDCGFGSLAAIYRDGNQNYGRLFKSLFLWQILFISGLGAVKTSILFFYLRIFPSEKFRKVVWVTIWFNIITTSTILILNFTVGRSVQLVWRGAQDLDASIKTYGVGLKIGFAHSAVNIALDIWMLILPMTQLYNLGLRRHKKIRVMSMFSMGVLLLVVSLVRMVMQIKVLPNPSEADSSIHLIIILGSIELYVGVVVACGPSIRQLLQYCFSRRNSSSLQTSNKPVFIDRSLVPIDDGDDEPTLRSDGGMTTTTISSTPTVKGRVTEMDVVRGEDAGRIV